MYHLCRLCSSRVQEICFFRNICNLNSICKCRNNSGYIIAVAWPFLRNSLKSSFICRLLLRSSMCSGKMRTWRRWWSLRTSCCAVLIDVHPKIRVSKSGWDYVHGSVRCDGQGTQPAVDVCKFPLVQAYKLLRFIRTSWFCREQTFNASTLQQLVKWKKYEKFMVFSKTTAILTLYLMVHPS